MEISGKYVKVVSRKGGLPVATQFDSGAVKLTHLELGFTDPVAARIYVDSIPANPKMAANKRAKVSYRLNRLRTARAAA